MVILRVALSRPGHAPVRAWLINISLSGAYLATAGALPVLGSIEIHVDARTSAASGCGALRLPGRIVRHGPAGVGIEWEGLASETLSGILRIAAPAVRQRMDLTRSQGRSPWTLVPSTSLVEGVGSIKP